MKNSLHLILLVAIAACNSHPEVRTGSVARETSTFVLDDKILLHSIDPIFQVEGQNFIYELSNDSSQISLNYLIFKDTFNLSLSQSEIRFKSTTYTLDNLEVVEAFYLPFVNKKPIQINGIEMPFERLYLFANCVAISQTDTVDCILSQSIRFETFTSFE